MELVKHVRVRDADVEERLILRQFRFVRVDDIRAVEYSSSARKVRVTTELFSSLRGVVARENGNFTRALLITHGGDIWYHEASLDNSCAILESRLGLRRINQKADLLCFASGRIMFCCEDIEKRKEDSEYELGHDVLSLWSSS